VAISPMLQESPFARPLAKMAPGETVENEAIGGPFVLEPGRPALVNAGGIGVPPFRSMWKYRVDTRLEKPLVLVRSSKTPEDIVFRAELEEFARRNDPLRVLHTLTRPEQSHEPWTGRKGRIDADLTRGAMRGVRYPLFHVAAPPAFVTESRRLIHEGLPLSDRDIRAGEFEGY
jgi:ferredoxin-NADP reductase